AAWARAWVVESAEAVILGQVGLNVARAEHRDADATRPAVQGKPSRESDHSMLGRVVRDRQRVVSDQPRERRRLDDVAAPALHHVGQEGTYATSRPQQD